MFDVMPNFHVEPELTEPAFATPFAVCGTLIRRVACWASWFTVSTGQFTVLPPGAVSIKTGVAVADRLTVNELCPCGIVFHVTPPLLVHAYDPEPPSALSAKGTNCPTDDCVWVVALDAVQDNVGFPVTVTDADADPPASFVAVKVTVYV
jgi:hypothetical protein